MNTSDNPDRRIDLEQELDDIVQRIEAKFNDRGHSTTEIHDALQNVLICRRKAYDEDPDPAEDPN